MRARVASVVGACTGVLLAACSPEASPPPDGEPARQPTDSMSSPAPADDDGGIPPDVSPLAWFMNELAMLAHDEDELRRTSRLMEERIAACMREQGFEYIPEDTRERQPSDGPSEFGDEWTALYGFGITTSPPDSRPLDPQSPNDLIIATMSDTERAAYIEALFGPGTRLAEIGDGRFAALPMYIEEEMSDVSSSCSSRAAAEVYGPPSGQQEPGDAGSMDEFRDLMAEMTALEARIERDLRIEAAVRGYGDCMADAGYPDFGGISHMDGFGHARALVLTRVAEAIGTNTSVDEVAVANGLVGLDPAVLRELRAFEVAMAVANRDCRRAVHDVQLAVRIEVEQAFLDVNRDELERYRERTTLSGRTGS